MGGLMHNRNTFVVQASDSYISVFLLEFGVLTILA